MRKPGRHDRRWLVLRGAILRPQTRRARDLGHGQRVRQRGQLGIPLRCKCSATSPSSFRCCCCRRSSESSIILATLDRHSAGGDELRLRRIATLPLRNPVILGSALGIAASATGFHATPFVQAPLKLLSVTAVPAALIALGASLCRAQTTADVGRVEISVITVLKLIAQPALACAAGLALQLSQPELLAVVVCAALPTAQNTFVFAQQYDVAEGLASRAVMVTTTLSLATIAGAAALLGH